MIDQKDQESHDIKMIHWFHLLTHSPVAQMDQSIESQGRVSKRRGGKKEGVRRTERRRRRKGKAARINQIR